MALTKDRVLAEKKVSHGPEFGHLVAKGFKVFRGSLVAVCQDGTIVPAGATNPPSPEVAVVGIARTALDNRGLDTGVHTPQELVWVQNGCFALPFDKEPTWTDLGKPVYAVDDELVTLTDPTAEGTTHLKLGILAGFEPDGTAFVTIGGAG